MSLSAHEFSARDKHTWNVRSQSDSALLPTTESGAIPFSTAKVGLQQRPRFQQRQPHPMQPIMHNMQGSQLPPLQLNPQLNPIAAPPAAKPIMQLQMELKARTARSQPTKTTTQQSPPLGISPPKSQEILQPQLAPPRLTQIQPPQKTTNQPAYATQQHNATSPPNAGPAVSLIYTTSTNTSASTVTASISTSTTPTTTTTTTTTTSSATATTNQNTSSQNLVELKKRGIHRRDLVKGSTALPPNMAFVPKKRPTPPPLPSPAVSPQPQEEVISSPLSPLPRRHSSAEPNYEFPNFAQQPALSTSSESYAPFTRRDSSDSSISVGSLGGVSLRGVTSTRNSDTLGVIGSGKSAYSSPPTPPPAQSLQSIPVLQSLPSLQSSAGLPPAPDMFSFLSGSSNQPSFFAGSPRSPLHIASSSSIPSPSLRSSSPLSNPNTYDLFAPSPSLFTPTIFDNHLASPNLSSSSEN